MVIWAPESQATKMLGDMVFSDKMVALHLYKGYTSTLTGIVRELNRLPITLIQTHRPIRHYRLI